MLYRQRININGIGLGIKSRHDRNVKFSARKSTLRSNDFNVNCSLFQDRYAWNFGSMLQFFKICDMFAAEMEYIL